MSYGVLHTDIGYVEDYGFPNKKAWDLLAMKYLAGQEQKLYGLLGQSDFKSFMAEIHRLLDKAEGIRDILVNFKKANLVTTFDLPQNIALTNQEVHLHMNKVKAISFEELFAPLEQVPGITVDTKGKTLTFIYNEANAKMLMNTLEQRKGRDAFKITGKGNLNIVNKAFKNWIGSHKEELGHLEINGTPTNVDLVSIPQTNTAKELFGLTKKEIEKILFENPEFQHIIIDTRQKVYDALNNLCSGSEDLQKIFDQVWTNKMGSIHSTNLTALLNFAFLSKGGNLTAGVTGAVQEMYGALLTEYLAFLTKQNLPLGLVKIVGNIIEGTEQPKADLQILNEIGIQVKAYGMNNQIKHMESNLHPDALDAQLRPYGAINVGDAIVQSVFNTDNESPASIASSLREYAAALLNLSTSKNLGVLNTVCFYLVDAQYLVPGSEIIKHFTEQPTEYEVRITSSFKGKSSAEYAERTYRAHNSKVKNPKSAYYLSPGFIEYFDKAGEESIHADKNNEKWYDLLYSNRISIRTTFDYGFMGVDIYQIF